MIDVHHFQTGEAAAAPLPVPAADLLTRARELYELAAQVSGSALLAGEVPQAKQKEQRALVYANACRVLSGLFCMVDDLTKLAAAPLPQDERAAQPCLCERAVVPAGETCNRCGGIAAPAAAVQPAKNEAVHLSHCYQGEYEGSCKYGHDDCPAAAVQPAGAPNA